MGCARRFFIFRRLEGWAMLANLRLLRSKHCQFCNEFYFVKLREISLESSFVIKIISFVINPMSLSHRQV